MVDAYDEERGHDDKGRSQDSEVTGQRNDLLFLTPDP
jgi:hypothetical protein